MDFDVTLLGTETCAYGVARAFHERYGIVSRMVGRSQLPATRFSRIIDPLPFEPRIYDPEAFTRTLTDWGRRLDRERPGSTHLLIACGDVYSALVSRCQEALLPYFAFRTVSWDLHRRLSDKASFYALCARYGLPHPATVVLNREDADTGAHRRVTFDYPVVLKPSDSVEYQSIAFAGRRKAYVLDTPQELDDTVSAIYGAGYTSEMICQDRIPGDDGNMKVLNAYVDGRHHVRSMILGHVLLGDPTPDLVGNYGAIVPDADDDLCRRIAAFLEDIGYEGVANMDMKLDPRDGECKLFEINLRPGRTNYFASANGLDLAQEHVDDLVAGTVDDGPTRIEHGSRMLLEIPRSTLRRHAPDGPAKDRALGMVRSGDWQWTLRYGRDMTLTRRILLARLGWGTARGYDRYMPMEGREDRP